MKNVRVNVERRAAETNSSDTLSEDIDRARRIATMLDSEFSIMGFRFGLETVVGMVPVVGDAVGLLAGLYPLHIVRKHKLGRSVERKIITNLLIEMAGGMLPVGGALFDAWFKANLANVRLLEAAVADADAGAESARVKRPRRAATSKRFRVSD